MPHSVPPHLKQAAKKRMSNKGEMNILPYPNPKYPHPQLPRKKFPPTKEIPGVDPNDPTRGRGTIPTPGGFPFPKRRGGTIGGAPTKKIPGVDPNDPTRGRGTIPSPGGGFPNRNKPSPEVIEKARQRRRERKIPSPKQSSIPPRPRQSNSGRVKVSQGMVDSLNKNGMQKNIELWRKGGQSEEFNEAFRRFYPKVAGGGGRRGNRARLTGEQRGRIKKAAKARSSKLSQNTGSTPRFITPADRLEGRVERYHQRPRPRREKRGGV